jgi:hypothetical protein
VTLTTKRHTTQNYTWRTTVTGVYAYMTIKIRVQNTRK